MVIHALLERYAILNALPFCVTAFLVCCSSHHEDHVKCAASVLLSAEACISGGLALARLLTWAVDVSIAGFHQPLFPSFTLPTACHCFCDSCSSRHVEILRLFDVLASMIHVSSIPFLAKHLPPFALSACGTFTSFPPSALLLPLAFSPPSLPPTISPSPSPPR